MPKCLFLVGIPLSGKTTFAHELHDDEWVILSRDEIRAESFGRGYKQNDKDEKVVNKIFDSRMEWYVDHKMNIIIDNTNLREHYINEIKKKLTEEYEVEIKYFPIPLWKAVFRNYVRWIKTGKWIPKDVIRNMHRRFKKLKYE